MEQRLQHCFKKIASLLETALTTQSEEGSGLGMSLRALLRKRKFSVRQTIGVQLAGLAFFSAIVVPQTKNVVSDIAVTMATVRNVIVIDAAPSVLQWPFRRFGISQYFSVVHPGMDLTNSVGMPIYPIGDGVVTWINYMPYGTDTTCLSPILTD
jgi:murein DD-endopeptidase MepM/ murein hydrolase activator NlpD